MFVCFVCFVCLFVCVVCVVCVVCLASHPIASRRRTLDAQTLNAPLGEGEDDDGVVVPLHDQPHDLSQVRLLALAPCALGGETLCVCLCVCVCVCVSVVE
jgi:hypothetical protein